VPQDDTSVLARLGWDERVESLLDDDVGSVPGRVVRVDLDSCQVATSDGDVRARSRTPVAVGDWVRVHLGETSTVSMIAPRWSQVTRRDPTGLTQVLAANVDLVLVAVPADRMSLARVEREVAVGWDSGAEPVVLMTKSDLDSGEAVQQLSDRLVGVDIISVSSVTGDGAASVSRLLQPARTGVLLGPSGAGKSTLTNLLAGREVTATGPVREGDRRGRHVTSARELQVLPSGGVLIDTPGLRSLSLAEDHGGVAAAFPDIEELGNGCRFRDCAHDHEPGCAVVAAQEAGILDGDRLANYRKLRRELDFQLRRDDPVAAKEARNVWKQRAKASRALFKERGH
jgi:ribosome biogenesis GTPase / thiamine phosphate phosphatase